MKQGGYLMFFSILFCFIVVVTLISIELKLRKQLENDERIIERLDILINKDNERD